MPFQRRVKHGFYYLTIDSESERAIEGLCDIDDEKHGSKYKHIICGICGILLLNGLFFNQRFLAFKAFIALVVEMFIY